MSRASAENKRFEGNTRAKHKVGVFLSRYVKTEKCR